MSPSIHRHPSNFIPRITSVTVHMKALTVHWFQLGGQCVCKINTEGRQCDRCEAGYFNMTSSDPDGCQQCVCDAVGTVNASTTCDAMTGQCPCKDNVDGVHCDRCKVGYFNLTDDNLAGCTTCSCDVAGTSTTDPSCDLLTGQCTCKKYVTGKYPVRYPSTVADKAPR